MSKYIDADRLIETLNKEKVPFNDDVNYFILNAPAADVAEVVKEWCDKRNCIIVAREDFPRLLEVRHGRWENDGHTLACSNCHTINIRGVAWHYCPNCGAKMDGDTE